MASKVQQQWQFAQRVKRELLAKLKEKDALIDEIEHLIQQFRIACESTIFQDFDYAVTENVDTHLWDAHGMINNRYRKIVGRYKSDEYKKNVVEKRKWEKRYADFLKTSQFYYKGYIQRLASHFDGLSELYKIAHRLQLSTLTADDRVKVSAETAHKILLSCHATLLHLGDLSRYRNALRTKDRSWESAMTHYELANDLYPDSGNAFNQMAVIALADADHLCAVYYLYRALAVNEPNEMAEGNLAIEFKKITTEWTSGNRRSGSTAPGMTGKAANAANPVISWFVRLHAKLYKGQDFSGHDELENEVLSQLSILLKEQSLDGILDKFVLINIAAEYFAGVRLQANAVDEHFQSYFFFLRLNVRMLFMLLQLLQPELDGRDDVFDITDATGKTKKAAEDCITPVIRRLLPALRQYSTWLVSKAPILVSDLANDSFTVHINEMWSIYCSTLSLLTNTFPPDNLPIVEYLLDEDAATVGFKPFRDSELCSLYTNENGLKPRISDPDIKQNLPNVEMLARIRDLLKDGMALAVDNRFPVQLVDGQFRYQEGGLSATEVVQESHVNPPGTIPDIQQYDSSSAVIPQTLLGSHVAPRPPSVAPSDSHQSMSTDMYQMVDNLVAPPAGYRTENGRISEDTSYGMNSSTARDVFGFVQRFPQQQAQQAQQRATVFPSIPGLPGQDSAFSPQPGELQSPDFERPSTATRLASLQLSDVPPQSPSPLALSNDRLRNMRPRNAWGIEVTPAASSPRLPVGNNVGQQLQQSLEQEYRASAAFSNSSSLYQGSPYYPVPVSRPAGPYGYDTSRNASTTYGDTSDYNRFAQIQSSLWNGSQPVRRTPGPTPPGGQGG